MNLILGTAQFGMRYGVAGNDIVPQAEVREILARAASRGIRLLDTAAAYGDIEARLAALVGGQPLHFVSKLEPLPTGLGAGEVAAWVHARLDQTERRLGERLHALMFHRAEDLLEDQGDRLWELCAAWAARRGCRLGVSCYGPATLGRVRERYPVAIAQLPGNAFDQRLRADPAVAEGVELHVRSAFLQGLLLMPETEAARRVPAAAGALARWHAWLRENRREPLHAALGFVKGLPGPTHCVVGVNDVAQLDAIAAAWESVAQLRADELAQSDPAVIDPRLWPPRS